jgi:hypothetical protein
MTFAQTTILSKLYELFTFVPSNVQRTCFPMLVRPRASRRLCTGFTIQLILGSRRIWNQIGCETKLAGIKKATHGFVVRVNENNLVVLVDTILIDPIRVQDS